MHISVRTLVRWRMILHPPLWKENYLCQMNQCMKVPWCRCILC